MSNTYIKTPISISFNEVSDNYFRLSTKSYKKIIFKNRNFKTIQELLFDDPVSGKEVGSLSYVPKSIYLFLRTKSIQNHSMLLDFSSVGTFEYIKPVDFIKNIGKEKKITIQKDDILFVTGGNVGAVAIADEDYNNIIFSSHIYKLPIISEDKYYIFSFLKNTFCKEQANFSPDGSIAGLDTFKKDFLLNIKIPFPNHNTENTIYFIKTLTQAIINKEKLIKQRHEEILKAVETELLENQKPNQFKFDLPTIQEIERVGRLDTNLYGKHFKKTVFEIQNYENGFQTINELGFTLSRGQNLQISNIGESIYSTKKHPNFYTLMLPKFLSKYGTVDTIEYLGNPNKLKTLQKGDLIFGAEGFEKGRSIVIIEEKERTITNIHGITIQQKEHDVNKAIFVKCFLDYFRNKGLIDLYAVGGNGGSLAQKYWDIIPFPNFPISKQKEIAKLYHNPDIEYQANNFALENFLEKDNTYNEKAGIYELDKTTKQLKVILNQAIDDIVNDKEVTIQFNYSE